MNETEQNGGIISSGRPEHPTVSEPSTSVERIAQTLSQIVADGGEDIFLDAYLFISMFRDYAPELKEEVMFWSIALERGYGEIVLEYKQSKETLAQKTEEFLSRCFTSDMISEVFCKPLCILFGSENEPDYPPIEGEMPEQDKVTVVGVYEDYLGAWRVYRGLDTAIRVTCMLKTPITQDMDLCLEWRVYGKKRRPITSVFRDVIHCVKGTERIRSIRELPLSEWKGDIFCVMARILPANKAQAKAYDEAHPEACLPDCFTSDRVSRYKSMNIVDVGDYIHSLTLKRVTVKPISCEPYDREFSIKLSAPVKKAMEALFLIKIFDPDGGCVCARKKLQPLKQWQRTIEMKESILRITENGVRFLVECRKGTYTYEISLYGSNTIRGTFEVEQPK